MTGVGPADVDIADFLAMEGFAGVARARPRALLESAGLTRPGKVRIANFKLDHARRLLHQNLAGLCDACRRLHSDLAGDREIVLVPGPECEVCSGSNNRRAGVTARVALHAADVRHVLVVGGMRAVQAALRVSLEDQSIEVRCIEGTEPARSAASVEADLAWAQVLMVWASTPLDHKVSLPYTAGAKGRLPTVTVARRGVAALCDELTRLVERSTVTRVPRIIGAQGLGRRRR